jgi:hypothetical protein
MKQVLLLPARTKYAEGCNCEACKKVEEYIRRLRASTAEMVERIRQSERITAADLAIVIY